MKELDSMPASTQIGKRGGGRLRIPQVRVLRVLARAKKGALSRTKISERCGNKTSVVVGRAIGYSDPQAREAFEQTKDGGGAPGRPCPSLLTLGHVCEVLLDVDGISEACVEITDSGRAALVEALRAMGGKLPAKRD